MDQDSFEFKLTNTSNEVYDLVKSKNDQGYTARMLANFAWNWTADKEGNRNGEIPDAIIEEHRFAMPWNARSISSTWAIHESGTPDWMCSYFSRS
ncbi:DNA/RNA helicase domain-containing protein [Paenibacillus sp. OK060]|uniref:DNA/RNA helicase domain-containing protein n=1 Tax=Paenibacillus sp. OK060 TaxID=1881034 RepID=UPI000B890D51